MLEMSKKILDQGGYFCAIFMDLSKAFDISNQHLLIAKIGVVDLKLKLCDTLKPISWAENKA